MGGWDFFFARGFQGFWISGFLCFWIFRDFGILDLLILFIFSF